MSTVRPGAWAVAALLAAHSLAGCKCEPTRVPLEAVPDIPYPSCANGDPDEAATVRRALVSGPNMRDQRLLETFEVRPYASGCRVIRVAQEWPLSAIDVDVVLDAEGLPLRVWRRTRLPGAGNALGPPDVRIYDLTTNPVRVAHLGTDGDEEGLEMRGERPRAVIGPGRGLLTAWIQRASLDVGEQVREPVIDVRESVALIRDVTLRREPNRDEPELGGSVRVYTVYGREAVFTDDDDIVVGDLFGLVRADPDAADLPDSMPDPGPIDPLLLR